MSFVVIEFEILSEPDLSMEDSGISGRGRLSTELVDHPDISGTDNNGSSDLSTLYLRTIWQVVPWQATPKDNP